MTSQTAVIFVLAVLALFNAVTHQSAVDASVRTLELAPQTTPLVCTRTESAADTRWCENLASRHTCHLLHKVASQ